MAKEDLAVAEAAVRFWNAGERESFLALFQPQASWSSAIKRQVEGGDGLYRGREEIGRFWDEWHAVWEDLEISFSERSNPHDGCVFAWGALRASGKASGAGTERPMGWVFQIEDGRIREVRAYLERDETLEAAGLTK
jgi:ketosteroid isomerase-like protein